jgi:O-antigen ligase
MADPITVALFEKVLSGTLVTVLVLALIVWQLWKRLRERDDKFDTLHRETLDAIHSLRDTIREARR